MSEIGLGLRRNENESWRDAVKRIASKQGMEHECLAQFDSHTEKETNPGQAAWEALYEWDCLDLYEDGKPA